MSPKTPSKSSKSQLPQNIWNQCLTCNFIILKSNNEQHECSKLNDNQSYLFKNELYSPTVIEHPKDIEKELEISKEFLFDFIFINPQTMNLCNFKIGDSLIVEFLQDNKIECFSAVCWPLVSIPNDKVALSKQNIFLNNINIDTVSPIRRVFSLQKEKLYNTIQLSLNLLLNNGIKNINLNDNDRKLLVSYIKEIYLNKYITKNQILNVTFLGQRFVFNILNLISNTKQKKLDDTKLNDKFEKLLTINDNTIQTTNIIFNELNLVPVDSNIDINQDINLYLIDKNTNVNVVNLQINDNVVSKKEVNLIKFCDIGGLNNEIELIKDLFIHPFELLNVYNDIGLDISKGVLLYGSSGCGKTLLAKAISNETKCNFIEINCGDIFSKNYGESELKLKEIFEKAWNCAPCILFIDELDTLCGRRESLHHDLEKRIVSLFSSLIDQSISKNILFLATTNKIDSIDTALRRPGRFDKEIEIPIPNQNSRYEILKINLKTVKHNLTENEIIDVSQNCHGYVGADLKMLVYEAGLMCIKRFTNKLNSENINEKLINKNDFFAALHKVKPSAMREITFDIPKVYWSDIGGQDDLKKKLQQAIIWPIKYANSFKRLGIKAPRGLLMYGPPGCSKTMIAKALATETGLNFIAVKGPELFSKWVGESERTVREIFRKARNAAPAIIFFDEIDAVAVERSSSSNKSNNVGDRVLAQLLNEIDGVENLTDVTIVAATNRPDMIDKALMRPGRLDRIVYVRLPDVETRREIFKLKFKKMPISENVDIEELVNLTENYSGAEITALCNEAAYLALEKDINSEFISQQNFYDALKLVSPRTSQDTINYFDNFHSISTLHKI